MTTIDPSQQVFYVTAATNATGSVATANSIWDPSNLITSAWPMTTNGNWAVSGGYVSSTPTKTQPIKTIPSRGDIQEIIDNVSRELSQINQKYNIFTPTLQNCDVLASRMFFNQAPKGCCEFGVSTIINGKRNVFLLAEGQEFNHYPAGQPFIGKYVVDICSQQYGGIPLQPAVDNLPQELQAEFRYKNPASLIKRLVKEGRPLKELSIKDAIALSTRYDITSVSPSHMDIHRINPSDTDGRKFLERFGKEVGFKTTLAQMLLDSDPIVAEKAISIAQILLQR